MDVAAFVLTSPTPFSGNAPTSVNEIAQVVKHFPGTWKGEPRGLSTEATAILLAEAAKKQPAVLITTLRALVC